jgi:hypothetical protein
VGVCATECNRVQRATECSVLSVDSKNKDKDKDKDKDESMYHYRRTLDACTHTLIPPIYRPNICLYASSSLSRRRIYNKQCVTGHERAW